MKKLLAILWLMFAMRAFADTHAAASCSSSDVQSVMNAASAGDIVTIPAGTCNWSSTVSWSAPANISVFGAGNLSITGGGDATVIVDDVASGSALIAVTTNATGAFRLAGLTIQGGTGLIKENGLMVFNGSSKLFRIDHVHLDKSTYSPQNNGKMIVIGGTINGVIDHCSFSFGYKIGWTHFVNSSGSGDSSWNSDTGFGSSNFVFMEDNISSANAVDGSPPVYLATMSDCHTGGRFVIRYNTLSNTSVGQTHPTGHAGDDRGCRAHEIYGNTITSTLDPDTEQPAFAMEYNNSGPALVWGNTADSMYKNIIYLNSIRKNNSVYNQIATPNGWGYCGTAFNGTGSNWDRNDDSSSGYPCLDQPGRGKGDLLSGDFPDKLNTTTDSISWANQALEPVYEWNNNSTIVPGWGGSWAAIITPDVLVANRDYYLYNGNTSCNQGAESCTAGVGVGTLAQRPGNCTTTSESGGGVAWWATDQGGNWNKSNGSSNDGMLYKCTATNTWTQYYTPYTYPHPLVNYNCDINDDGTVDSTDLSFLADVILGVESSQKGDVNRDGVKDILDIMKINSVILGRSTCP